MRPYEIVELSRILPKLDIFSGLSKTQSYYLADLNEMSSTTPVHSVGPDLVGGT